MYRVWYKPFPIGWATRDFDTVHEAIGFANDMFERYKRRAYVYHLLERRRVYEVE